MSSVATRNGKAGQHHQTRPATQQSLRRRSPKPFVPTASSIRKEAKPQDWGSITERLMTRRAVRAGVDCWRKPGIRGERLSGGGMLPDGAGYLVELEGLCDAYRPDVKDKTRQDWIYNLFLSIKRQYATGSAAQKVSFEIMDIAHLCDLRRIVGALLLDMPVLSKRELERFRAEGRQHGVVVLTRQEVDAGMLLPALVEMAKLRNRLYRKLGARGGITLTSRSSAIEVAYWQRRRIRAAVERAV